MVISIGLTACSVLGSVSFGCLDFLAVSEDKEMPKNKKIFRIFTDALTILTSPISLIGNIVRLPAVTRFALHGAAAAASVTHKVAVLSSKQCPIGLGDYLDLGGGALISVCGLVNDAIIFKPQFFGSAKQGIEIAANIGSAVGTFAENRATFLGVWGRIERLVKHFKGHPLVVVVPDQGTGKPCINLTPADAEPIYHMQKMRTIDELEEIPSLFHYDDVLQQFRCALTGNPIRHLLVVAGTEEWEHPIWFESRAILQKIEEREKPAQWPKGIAFARKNLQEFPAKQKQIDKVLKGILDDIKKSELRFNPIEDFDHPEDQKYLQIVALLKQIGLEKINTMQDVEICTAVTARVSANTIESVKVNTIWYRFNAGEKKKLTKAIHFTPTVTWLSKPPLSEEELFAATRAALMSKDPEDKKSLLLADKPFEIRVSTDLKNLMICSEFVRPDYERKTDLLYRMKKVLHVKTLERLSDDELANKIVAGISKKAILNISVYSLAYKFAETSAPKPARSIIFAPPIFGRGGEASADSLYAAARFVFGSQSEIDKSEFKKDYRFIIYLDNKLRDIAVTEFVKSDEKRKTEVLKSMKRALQVKKLDGLSDEELEDRIVARISKKVILNVEVRSLEYQFAEATLPLPARSIVFSPLGSDPARKASSVHSLLAAARFLFGSECEKDKQELKKNRTFSLYVDSNFQHIDIKEFLNV